MNAKWMLNEKCDELVVRWLGCPGLNWPTTTTKLSWFLFKKLMLEVYAYNLVFRIPKQLPKFCHILITIFYVIFLLHFPCARGINWLSSHQRLSCDWESPMMSGYCFWSFCKVLRIKYYLVSSWIVLYKEKMSWIELKWNYITVVQKMVHGPYTRLGK